MNHTPFSHLSDDELQKHIYNKEEATHEEIELARRLELLQGSYEDLLQKVHQSTSSAQVALTQLHRLTAPVHKADAAPLPLQ